MTFSEDIFPKPGKLIHNIFRCCGSCPRCIADPQGYRNRDRRDSRGSPPNYGQHHMEEKFRERSIKTTVPGGSGEGWEDVLDGEYILICSSGKPLPIFSQMSSCNPPVYYISNYGREFMITDNGRGCQLSSPSYSGGREGLFPLTQEFINYYNSIDFWNWPNGSRL